MVRRIIQALLTVIICLLVCWRFQYGNEKVKFYVLDHERATLTFIDLLAMAAEPGMSDRARMARYTHYFQNVALYFPNDADGHAMLGFCQAKTGRLNEALASYQRAARLTTHTAGIYYNMGVLYLARKDTERAVASFHKVLDVPFQESVLFLVNSKIYIDILSTVSERVMAQDLQMTYVLSIKLAQLAPLRSPSDTSLPSVRMF